MLLLEQLLLLKLLQLALREELPAPDLLDHRFFPPRLHEQSPCGLLVAQFHHLLAHGLPLSLLLLVLFRELRSTMPGSLLGCLLKWSKAGIGLLLQGLHMCRPLLRKLLRLLLLCSQLLLPLLLLLL